MILWTLWAVVDKLKGKRYSGCEVLWRRHTYPLDLVRARHTLELDSKSQAF